MARWGLSGEQRRARPWGLPERILRSAKSITNSVEGDVYLTRLEQLFVDSPPVQRLRRVRQLGTSRFVYPDGDHSRFSHSLGALRVAQDLMDSALQQNTRPHPQEDLFSEWWEELGGEQRSEYDRRVAEATVLARLGALLHDLGHLPFSHTVEDELGLLPRHDESAERFLFFWDQIVRFIEEELRADANEAEVADQVMASITGALKIELEHLVLSGADVPPSAGLTWESA
ncbi:MAG: uncharacterized protein QOJ29_1566, partial [Thermoleophilaceae bacterium]|nr:uncharacterized protein [Thermoleophilaceae bacterium]